MLIGNPRCHIHKPRIHEGATLKFDVFDPRLLFDIQKVYLRRGIIEAVIAGVRCRVTVDNLTFNLFSDLYDEATISVVGEPPKALLDALLPQSG